MFLEILTQFHIKTQKYKQEYYKKKCNIFIPSTHSEELVAVYPSIQAHIPSRHVAYRDPVHCSFKSQDWFKGMFSETQTNQTHIPNVCR